MSLTIQRAGIADLDALTRLFDEYRQFYRQNSQPDACREFLRARLERAESVVFLAVDDATATGVGFTQLYPGFSSVRLRPIWQLNDLYVQPRSRGRGAGLALLDAAREHARITAAACLILETTAENTYAQGVYERYGYTRLDPGQRFYMLPMD